MARPNFIIVVTLFSILALTLVARPASVSAAESSGSSGASVAADFAVSPRLRKNVDFWISIYTRYSNREGVIHDAKYVDLVYEVVDARGPGAARAAKKKWRDLLLSIHRKQRSGAEMTGEEKKLFTRFADIHEPDKFLNAAHRKRLRFQLGQRDNFMAGLVSSGRYIPAMEEVFKAEGLPPQLARLPFVESSFNLNARSKVGASGIWQFMRSTAKLYVRVDDAVDERDDPIRAAEAAAKLLKANYESLGSWPLAVTAYNHGRKGMMRAVRQVGSSSLDDLIDGYRSPSFGFASSNFYAELVAAIEIERDYERHFGKVARLAPYASFEARLPAAANLREIARLMKFDVGLLRELNPALSESVLKGRRIVPAGYLLRLPHDGSLAKDAAARVFLAGFERIPAGLRRTGL